jgi:hypothetical protein
MNNIPKSLKEDMASDPFYKRCCITGASALHTKIEWHHNLIFAGRQVQEKWCILPLAKAVHDKANDKGVREKLDWVMLNRASEDELRRYSKAINLKAKRDMLNGKFGVWGYPQPTAR